MLSNRMAPVHFAFNTRHAPHLFHRKWQYSLCNRMLPQPALDCYYVTRNNRRLHMPDVKIEWNSGRTQDQKDKVAKAITDALVDIAKAPRENVKITFKDNPV